MPRKRRAPSGVKLTWRQFDAPKESIVTGPANSPAVKLPNRSLPPGSRPRPIENGSPKLMTSGMVSEAGSTWRKWPGAVSRYPVRPVTRPANRAEGARRTISKSRGAPRGFWWAWLASGIGTSAEMPGEDSRRAPHKQKAPGRSRALKVA
jgi:hypothetical protein